jgi:hypothetical protein
MTNTAERPQPNVELLSFLKWIAEGTDDKDLKQRLQNLQGGETPTLYKRHKLVIIAIFASKMRQLADGDQDVIPAYNALNNRVDQDHKIAKTWSVMNQSH